MLKVYFDGGCRPGARLETCVVMRGVATIRDEADAGDSADAEWLALIRAAGAVAGAGEVVFIGDSALVVAQANGAPCRRAGLAAHRAAFLALVAGLPRWRVRHVRRGKNLAGIALAARRAR